MAMEFPNLDCATSSLNFDTCLSILLSFDNLSNFISSKASPGPSYGENNFSKLFINALYILKVISSLQSSSSLITQEINSCFQIEASLSFMNDMTNAIFLSSML